MSKEQNNSNTPKRFDFTALFEQKSEIKENTKETMNVPIDEVQKKWLMNDKIVDLFAQNIEKDQKLREKYAIILVTMLGITLIALITIFILVGCGILNYSDTTFNIFVTGGIAEIFALVSVIVKYLFKDNLTQALTIILENNNQQKNTYKSQQRYKKDVNKSSDKPREI